METRNWIGRVVCVLLLCVAGRASAQTYTVVTSLSAVAPPSGAGNLVWSLVQGLDGNFYGATEAGGGTCANNPFASCGTVFKVTPAGVFSVLHEFCQGSCTDGGIPYAGLVLSPSGNFYGTTTQDEVNRGGTLYEITPTGTVTTLHSYTGAGGDGTPYGPVVQAYDAFYGITGNGGSSSDGTVYKVTTSGTLTTLGTFSGTNGLEIPYAGQGLIEAANGDFYGVTSYGTESTNGCGSIFKVTPQGTLSTAFGFINTSADGCGPSGSLVQVANGNFYGVTISGGTGNNGVIFQMTPAGAVTLLHSFCSESNCADGTTPNAGLTLGSDGNFYGTTIYGGAFGEGVIYQMTPSGTFKVLYSFCSQSGCSDGALSYSSLIQATDGNFYGTTSSGGGSGNGGTVYKLSMGLAAFVESIPASGKVGTQVEILGTDLTGATSVTFDGTAATFKVKTPTLIVATVPKGASSGKIRVETPTGALLSNVAFRVR